MVSTTFITTASLALASIAAAATSTCPFNYPVVVNTTTSRNGLVLTVISNTAATNNRAVQLRPNPFLEGGFFAGVDNSPASGVLLANLREGGIYSQARNQVNQLYDLGPTGYLNQRDVSGNTTRWTFAFADPTVWPGEVERAWQLSAPTSDGTYGLYHEEGVGITNGFILCQSDVDTAHGPWWQLYYVTSSGQSTEEFAGCEYVGLRTTVAARIENGACDIGGFTSS